MRRILPILFVMLIHAATVFAEEKCEVVFLADLRFANNPQWIEKIKTWGATGINLTVYRSEIESSYGQFDFAFVRSCLKTIAENDLDIYIRASMGLLRPTWVDRYTKDDFHQTTGGVLFDNYNAAEPGHRLLNLTSERSRNDLLRFFRAIASELKSQPLRIRSKVKAIIPTMSPDDETEFPSSRHPAGVPAGQDPWGWLSGYSGPEKQAFVRFLKLKYNGSSTDASPAKLNKAWGASFASIDLPQINIDSYDWERPKDVYSSYPSGRKDFLEFRTSELKRFIDDCAAIARGTGFLSGVQFGSIYDVGIEFRGFIDVTPLVENADYFINDEVPEYSANFEFMGDYQRSICRYWEWARKQKGISRPSIKFGTESNWPGYNNIRPQDLVSYWMQQLTSTYDRGATVLFVSHWGTESGIVRWKHKGGGEAEQFLVADLVKDDELDKSDEKGRGTAYAGWRRALRNFAASRPKKIAANAAVVLSFEQALTARQSDQPSKVRRAGSVNRGEIQTFDGERSGTLAKPEFPASAYVRRKTAENPAVAASGKTRDIVTEYMLVRSPGYGRNYRTLGR